MERCQWLCAAATTISLFGIREAVAQEPARLSVRFPSGHPGVSEPLVSTGIPGAGDLLFVTYVGSDHVQFGHDNMGAHPSPLTRHRQTMARDAAKPSTAKSFTERYPDAARIGSI